MSQPRLKSVQSLSTPDIHMRMGAPSTMVRKRSSLSRRRALALRSFARCSRRVRIMRSLRQEDREDDYDVSSVGIHEVRLSIEYCTAGGEIAFLHAPAFNCSRIEQVDIGARDDGNGLRFFAVEDFQDVLRGNSSLSGIAVDVSPTDPCPTSASVRVKTGALATPRIMGSDWVAGTKFVRWRRLK